GSIIDSPSRVGGNLSAGRAPSISAAGSPKARRIVVNDLNDKRERIMRLCHASRLDGVLLGRQANFGWITGGRSNRIDGTVELGAGALFITANGRVVLLANTIEMPRLLDEALAGISCEAVEYPWTDD